MELRPALALERALPPCMASAYEVHCLGDDLCMEPPRGSAGHASDGYSAVVLTTRMTSRRLLPLSSRVLNIRAGCFERPTSAPLSFSMPEEEDRYRQRNEIYPGDLVFFR